MSENRVPYFNPNSNAFFNHFLASCLPIFSHFQCPSFFGYSAARHLAQHPDDLSTSELHQLLDSWPFNSWFTQQRLPKNQDYDELHMGVSKVMGVAPVIIH
jgi:hypothetical protein